MNFLKMPFLRYYDSYINIVYYKYAVNLLYFTLAD